MVGVITPWNSPLLLLALEAAPALAAGNTVVIKPSEFTSASTLEFMKLVEEAGFPPGVVNVVTGFGAEVGRAAGRASARREDRLHRLRRDGPEDLRERGARLKHVTLELGGKSPNIVFDDADLDDAVKGRDLRHLRRDRPDLHRRLAPAGAARDPRPVRREAGRLREDRADGRPDDARHAGRPGHDAAAVREGARLHRRSPRAKARTCVLGGGPYRGPRRQGLVRRADHLHRRAQRHAHRPGRSVRPGAVGHPVQGRGRGASRIANDVAFGLAAGVWTQNIRRALRMAERCRPARCGSTPIAR